LAHPVHINISRKSCNKHKLLDILTPEDTSKLAYYQASVITASNISFTGTVTSKFSIK